jgi:hypothetical protein
MPKIFGICAIKFAPVCRVCVSVHECRCSQLYINISWTLIAPVRWHVCMNEAAHHPKHLHISMNDAVAYLNRCFVLIMM